MSPDERGPVSIPSTTSNVRSILPELVARAITNDLDGRAAATVAAGLAADANALRALRALVKQADQIADGVVDKKPPGVQIYEVAAELAEFAKRPRLSTGFAELDAVAPWPVQCIATIVAPPGMGKSSLALQIAQHHQRATGPVLILSRELARVLVAARIASQNLAGPAWIDILDGKIAQADVATSLAGLDIVIIDEVRETWVADARAWLAHWKKTRPRATPLVVIDYLQIMPAERARDDGERVKMTLDALSEQIVKPYNCGALAISKSSRANSRALRTGESFGSDTAESGAETNAIEFYSTAQISIGGRGDEAHDGWAPVDVSVGKARYRGGDHVVPFEFHGRWGLFRAKGDARTTAEVRRERAGGKEKAKVDAKRDAIVALLATKGAQPTKAILQAVAGRDREITALLRQLADEKVLGFDGNGYSTSWFLLDQPKSSANAGATTRSSSGPDFG